jgi:hypothetical protein
MDLNLAMLLVHSTVVPETRKEYRLDLPGERGGIHTPRLLNFRPAHRLPGFLSGWLFC